ncbi:hypothetical protein [Cryobacterium sp. PH29-G1]|uniref:hypothetical protein n=1 Tax=Cryobacterium sp. PH29-G1 TaxID=3046211 RepID=UPI0024B8918F|nr:hypothetical protein [Cryobacterium sp. PH29-G1]MDJ0350868.1 hypothetical protein [Cryobacterium sp. PH29-G1]
MSWTNVEEQVRTIAETVWSSPCKSEMIAGVQCDGVIHVRKDYLVLIEISVRDDLAKLREDVSKLVAMKSALMSQGKYAETYFVTSQDKHPSITVTADAAGIEFHTLETFASKFLASKQYTHERSSMPFGSAVVPQTGVSDQTPYTVISYVDSKGKKYLVDDIASALKKKQRIILLGEFGTGKSRCIKETFAALSDSTDAFAAVAINLRDNWGYKRLDHMLRNHLDGLGLSDFADNLVKSIRHGNHPVLLDGFDEIGSQSWSGNSAMLAEVRRKSLEGVRDAVEASGGAGILITGREHYFSTDKEMLDCLGLDDRAVVLRCPDEFTEAEAAEYIKAHSASSFIPDWMPRKPLVCQLLVGLDIDEIEALKVNAYGELEFFEQVVDAVCRRETRINPSIDADTVKSVLLHLAQQSRTQPAQAERLTLPMINEAFYSITGYAPIDESAILLQRLPYLGRVGAESSDRSFIDPYARSGLRGLAIEQTFSTKNVDATREAWLQPLDDFGLRIWARRLARDQSPLKYVRQCLAHGNNQAGSDYVAARLMTGDELVDFEKLSLDDGEISELFFVDVTVRNLSLTNIHVAHLSIENARLENVFIDNCVMDRVEGVSSQGKLPPSFGPKCQVEEYDSALSSSRISTLNLSDSQKTLLALIKKLFFQPGSGRREEALLRGTEAYWVKASADGALRYMEQERMVRKVKGNDGWLYIPERRHMKRMGLIVSEQKQSIDPLWLLAG